MWEEARRCVAKGGREEIIVQGLGCRVRHRIRRGFGVNVVLVYTEKVSLECVKAKPQSAELCM